MAMTIFILYNMYSTVLYNILYIFMHAMLWADDLVVKFADEVNQKLSFCNYFEYIIC